ncbi:MAG: hypothetical protein Q7U51_12650, partial [Methanoregula sp.]|nr:hypothetical protein [Methanoregula sp.]
GFNIDGFFFKPVQCTKNTPVVATVRQPDLHIEGKTIPGFNPVSNSFGMIYQFMTVNVYFHENSRG